MKIYSNKRYSNSEMQQQFFDITALSKVLSAPRIQTYINATGNDTSKALSLYHLNLKLSNAFYLPFHFAEISTRNGIVAALEEAYGPEWFKNGNFIRSLPRNDRPLIEIPLQSFPQNEIVTSGKLTAEIKFVFWEKMMTRRHDQRLWEPHIQQQFPNFPPTTIHHEARFQINEHLSQIRKLRNRTAHHEPIFNRDLRTTYHKSLSLIRMRSAPLAQWIELNNDLPMLIQELETYEIQRTR